jgi:hypothetical protein
MFLEKMLGEYWAIGLHCYEVFYQVHTICVQVA